MASIEENSNVYGGFTTDGESTNTFSTTGESSSTFNTVTPGTNTMSEVGTNLPTKTGFWNKIKAVLFYEIKVELTPYQQKIEDEINEFLYQEITWERVKNFLFQDVKSGTKK